HPLWSAGFLLGRLSMPMHYMGCRNEVKIIVSVISSGTCTLPMSETAHRHSRRIHYGRSLNRPKRRPFIKSTAKDVTHCSDGGRRQLIIHQFRFHKRLNYSGSSGDPAAASERYFEGMQIAHVH